jgi:hypothetical protein
MFGQSKSPISAASKTYYIANLPKVVTLTYEENNAITRRALVEQE